MSQGLILGGMQSSGGKTVVTCLLLAALKMRGLGVQPFKVGPDFIDPGYHRGAAGTPSYNLDFWLMGAEEIQSLVQRLAGAKIGLVEGVMGLFDGSDPRSDQASTMELARLLNWPVVLVIPAAKSGRSLSAALRGFMLEAGPQGISGVVLNGVSGRSHSDYLREAIEPLGMKVLGAIPPKEELRWPERYLGLQAVGERNFPTPQELANIAEDYLDINEFLNLAGDLSNCSSFNCPLPVHAAQLGDLGQLGDLPLPSHRLPSKWVGSHLRGDRFRSAESPANELSRNGEARRRIAVALDEAFHFYYQANLDFLESNKVELVPFSPIHDPKLPTNISGLFLGGGFPELYAEAIADNVNLRSELKAAIDGGLPCYAECGGLMFLAEQLVTREGKRFPATGVIPGSIEMSDRLQYFGYCECSGLRESPGAIFHGHEFHYSRWQGETEFSNLWAARKKRSRSVRREGFRRANLKASYVHLYFPSSEAALSQLFRRDAT